MGAGASGLSAEQMEELAGSRGVKGEMLRQLRSESKSAHDDEPRGPARSSANTNRRVLEEVIQLALDDERLLSADADAVERWLAEHDLDHLAERLAGVDGMKLLFLAEILRQVLLEADPDEAAEGKGPEWEEEEEEREREEERRRRPTARRELQGESKSDSSSLDDRRRRPSSHLR